MSTLIVVRHAKALTQPGLADRERELSPRGEIEAKMAGRLLAPALAQNPTALVSPAKRTQQTWALIAAESNVAVVARLEARMYAASGDDLLEIARSADPTSDTVILVGHNPGCAELIAHLTGGPARAFPTAAVARLMISESWPNLAHGQLIDFEVPRAHAD